MKLILDNIRSTYNVGSIFRTADAFGIEEIICAGYTPTPEHETLQKTALGAQNSVQWRHVQSTLDAVRELQAQGYLVAALEVGGEDLRAFAVRVFDQSELHGQGFGTMKQTLAVILGNETEGIGQEVLAAADVTVGIPMRGAKESMNVSVTAGIVMFALSGLK